MGISIWQLLIVLGIVILLFGTKKLRNLGGDLGSAVKSFKSAVKEAGAGGDDSMKKQIEDEDTTTADVKETSDSKDKV